MIDTIKTLLNRTSELEDKINKLSTNQNADANSNSFVCFSKGLINLSFLNSNQLLLAEFETKKNIPLYFQNQIELNIPTSQDIKISLIINDIAIFKSTRKLQAGYNQFTLMKSYIPIESEQVKLYLKITTENSSPITIISDTLFVWGLSEIFNDISYQSIDIGENFLLSYLNNNVIFYSIVPKSEISLNCEDFTYYGNALSHSFVYNSNLNKIFLFRVDIDGNLFYTNFEENNENFIEQNVTQISTSYGNDKTVISIIKNGKCYIREMDNNENISNATQIENLNLNVTKSYIFFNQLNNKFYLILSDKNNSNYITESILENQVEHHYINANYSISYSTYGITTWN